MWGLLGMETFDPPLPDFRHLRDRYLPYPKNPGDPLVTVLGFRVEGLGFRV